MQSVKLIGIYTLLILNISILAIEIPDEVRQRLDFLGHVIIHTYKQPYNEQNPQIDGGFVLDTDQLEKLGSECIFADIIFTDIQETTSGYTRSPIELRYIDKKTFQTILDLAQAYPNTPSCSSFGYTLDALPSILAALDYLMINKNILLPVLLYAQPFSVAQLCRESNPYPHLSDLIRWTAQQKVAWKPSVSFKGFGIPVTAVAITPDGQRIISGYPDGGMVLWQLLEHRWQSTLGFRGHTRKVNALLFSSDGRLIVSGSSDHTAQIWAEIGDHFSSVSIPFDNEVTAIALTPDKRTYIFGLANNLVIVYESSRSMAWSLPGHTQRISSVSITANGNHIVSCSEDGSSCHWTKEVTQHNIIWEKVEASYYQEPPTEPEINLAAISADGQYLVKISKTSSTVLQRGVHFYHHKQFLDNHSFRTTSLAITPDVRTIVTSSKDSTLSIYRKNFNEKYVPMGCLAGHTDEITCVAISADGSRIVSGSKDGTIQIWELESVEEFCHRLSPAQELQQSTNCLSRLCGLW